MMKIYKNPQVYIITLAEQDVITFSSGLEDPDAGQDDPFTEG